MSKYDDEAEESIGAAAAAMSESVVALVLRHLVIRGSAEGRPEFYSLDVMDILEAHRLGMSESIAVIRILESRGLIRITGRAGVETNYTHFELTERGLRAGSPRSGFSLLSLVGSTGGGALLYAAGVVGVGTGVLGLASLWTSVTGRDWSETIAAGLTVWDTAIQNPLRGLLSAPLRLVGLGGPPAWLVDYLALGGLVWASSLRARQVIDLEIGAPPRVGWAARVVTLLITLVLWPWVAFFEVVFMGRLVATYILWPTTIDDVTRTFLPPDRVIARWVTFALPFALFAFLLGLSAWERSPS